MNPLQPNFEAATQSINMSPLPGRNQIGGRISNSELVKQIYYVWFFVGLNDTQPIFKIGVGREQSGEAVLRRRPILSYFHNFLWMRLLFRLLSRLLLFPLGLARLIDFGDWIGKMDRIGVGVPARRQYHFQRLAFRVPM